MNLMLLYESWGINNNPSLALHIRHQHRNQYTYLFKLDLILHKGHTKEEVPHILNKHSDVLGCTMLQYMAEVPCGASHIIELIEYV